MSTSPENPFFLAGSLPAAEPADSVPPAGARARADAPPPASADLPEIRSGSNPLVTAANHLLNFIPQIRALITHPDPSSLRNYLVQEVRRFEMLVRNHSVAPETVIGARYCLCTALDETAAQTPWGGSGAWSKHSLLVTFHNETWGGEKFFQLMAKLSQDPQRHADLLELMYYCIALGFEGRFRVVENGRMQLETLKQRLVGMVQTVRGERAKGLSPHWQGVAAPAAQSWERVPLWIAGGVAAMLAFLIYLAFTFRLAGFSDTLFGEVDKLRMPRLTIVARPAATPRIGNALVPEVERGLLAVRDEADRSVVTLRGDGLFESGSATVRNQFLPVLSRVAGALRDTPGQVVVSGYTDNTPIRTARFPSNYQLSEARAQAVKQLIDPAVGGARVRAEGRADADPVAPNADAEGRSRNRRVEITLLPSAGGDARRPAEYPR